VIAVIVRVDHKTYLLVGNAQIFQRSLNLLGEGRVLIVDDHDAVFPNGSRNVSSRALKHVDVPETFVVLICILE
jgi:hypothetical protein